MAGVVGAGVGAGVVGAGVVGAGVGAGVVGACCGFLPVIQLKNPPPFNDFLMRLVLRFFLELLYFLLERLFLKVAYINSKYLKIFF